MKNTLELKKLSGVSGKVILPGSKSLSNRALLISALAKGNTKLLNVLKSDDTSRMIEALEALKIKLNVKNTTVDVNGIDGVFDEGLNSVELFLGNAGTAMRPLCAALAVSQGVFTLTGEPRMMERPIGPLTEALKSLGLNIEYLNNDGFPPLRIRGGTVKELVISRDCRLEACRPPPPANVSSPKSPNPNPLKPEPPEYLLPQNMWHR